MPTLSFLFYLFALGAAWLFHLSYRGWFGLYLVLAMAAVPALLFLISLPAMLSLHMKAEAPGYTTRDDDAKLSLHFETKRLLPVGSVCVVVYIRNRFALEEYRIPCRYYGVRSCVQQVTLPTDLCGALDIQIQRVECRDLLGLFCIRQPCPASLICTVLPPALAPEEAVDFDAALKSVSRLKPKYGGGFSEDHDLRDYRPGDMSNTIHWKLSSKADKLIVREALEQENREIFLVLEQAGQNDRGLEVLYWLSLELCRRELPHRIVANTLYLVGNEHESASALAGILAFPIDRPCGFDASTARSIFRISSGEVTAH